MYAKKDYKYTDRRILMETVFSPLPFIIIYGLLCTFICEGIDFHTVACFKNVLRVPLGTYSNEYGIWI